VFSFSFHTITGYWGLRWLIVEAALPLEKIDFHQKQILFEINIGACRLRWLLYKYIKILLNREQFEGVFSKILELAEASIIFHII